MSSSTNRNSSNGPSQVTGHPSTSSTREFPAQNGTFHQHIWFLISQCDGNTRDQVESPSTQVSTNSFPQGEHRAGTFIYTELLSQNGSFGDHFWRVNDNSQSGNNVANSKAWSTAINKGTEGASKDGKSRSQADNSQAGQGAEAKTG